MPANRRSRRSSPALIFSLVASLCASTGAQQQPKPKPSESDDILRVTTEIVQTDVSVFDKGGKFVDNLKPEQFELKVDGRVQPVSFFERVVAGSVNEDAQLAAARGAGHGGDAATANAVPLDRGRAVVFFLDDLHLSLASLVHTKEMLLRFIDAQLRQNDQMVIATTSNQLGFLSQLTDDKTVLRTAVSRLTVREQTEKIDTERPQMNVTQAIAIEQGNLSVVDYFVDQTIKENPVFGNPSSDAARAEALRYVTRRALNLIDIHSSIVMRTFDSLRAVLKTFAEYPGRKLVYFFSDGFAMELSRSSTYDRVHFVTDAAVRAGAVVYTVDARGLGAQLEDLPSAADNSSPDLTGRLASAGLSMTTTMQEPLRTIAGETGGRAILNTDSIDLGVQKALKDTSVYYLLAWKPEREENRGGKFRHVEVAVKDRPDLTVLVQRGFYTTPPDAAPKRDAQKAEEAEGTAGAAHAAEQERTKELFAALRAPFPRVGLPTALTLNYLKLKDVSLLLLASVQVESEASKPTAGGAPPTDRVEIVGAIYNDQGKVVQTFQRGINITPKEASVETARTRRVFFPLQAPITPGLYQVRVASRDPKSHRTGSAVQWIEVPDVNKGAFALSSLFLGVRPPQTSTEADANADAAAPQVLVVADRRFARNAPTRFLLYLYNAAVAADAKPDLAVQVQVFRDDQPVVTTPLRKVNVEGITEFSRLSYAAEVSMNGIPSGRYEMRVTAIDRVAKASATRSVKFVIE
ncbi:MAG: VWA domain-containing protein [Pyrinomonadaceae bacterium]